MTDELVDYFDERGTVIGYCPRSEAEAKNYITANAIIFIFDSLGKVLLQKRAMTKKHYPGLWDALACGGVAHGEDPLEAAERETLEEIGIRCKLRLVERFMNPFPSENGQLVRTRLSYLFVGTSDDPPTHNDEVEEVRSFGPDPLLANAKARPSSYVPSFGFEFSKALSALQAG